MSKGMLVDVTRCIACRGCQVACKQWNDKPGETTSSSETGTNPPVLSAKTWTLIDIKPEVRENGTMKWSFAKLQCMHCNSPACVSACPVAALTKDDNGPVVYREERCIGCRYCMIACPFGIPKFEWDKAIPTIQKCSFCFDRIDQGIEPACAKTCPTEAMVFGEREDLVEQAKARIYGQPGKYVAHIYGEKEVGGTSWLYISDVPFEKLGFPLLGDTAYPDLTWEALNKIPWEVLAVAVITGGVWYIRRRQENEKAKELAGKEGK
ncbi:MAG: 4Fe-4S dicluster domain-containing protein [Chloroflexota bacterium]|nr:4Fe-4S dicluster domain-containing protein [Chloroflexota bacterium]